MPAARRERAGTVKSSCATHQQRLLRTIFAIVDSPGGIRRCICSANFPSELLERNGNQGFTVFAQSRITEPQSHDQIVLHMADTVPLMVRTVAVMVRPVMI